MLRRLTRLRPVPGAGAPHLSVHSFPPAPAAPNRNAFWPTPAPVGLTSGVFLMSHQCVPRRRPMAAAPGLCACPLGSHPGSQLPGPGEWDREGRTGLGDSRREAGAERSRPGPARSYGRPAVCSSGPSLLHRPRGNGFPEAVTLSLDGWVPGRMLCRPCR